MAKLNYVTAWFAALRKMQLNRKPIDFAVTSYIIGKLNSDAWTVTSLITDLKAIKRYANARNVADVKDSIKRLHANKVIQVKKPTQDSEPSTKIIIEWYDKPQGDGKHVTNNNNNKQPASSDSER